MSGPGQETTEERIMMRINRKGRRIGAFAGMSVTALGIAGGAIFALTPAAASHAATATHDLVLTAVTYNNQPVASFHITDDNSTINQRVNSSGSAGSTFDTGIQVPEGDGIEIQGWSDQN